MANAAPTVALTTIAGAPEITIFAAVVATPSVGSVWAAVVENREKVASDFDPDSKVTIDNSPVPITFEVDQGYESVTWSNALGMLETVSIPQLQQSETLRGGSSAPPSSAVGGVLSRTQAGAPASSGFESRTGAASSSSSTAGQSGLQDTTAKKPASKSNIGPIVGGVVGGIAVLAAVIFLVWFLLRRRKRRQALASSSQPATLPRHDDDKYPVEDQGALGHHPHHGVPAHNGIPELPYTTTTPARHELDPAKGNTAAMRANELETAPGHGEAIARKPLHVPELAGGAQGQGQGQGRTAWRQELGEDRRPDAEHGAHQVQQPQQEASPFVEAQRRLEMDWLESEEARLRSKRELLKQQQQGGK